MEGCKRGVEGGLHRGLGEGQRVGEAAGRVGEGEKFNLSPTLKLDLPLFLCKKVLPWPGFDTGRAGDGAPPARPGFTPKSPPQPGHTQGSQGIVTIITVTSQARCWQGLIRFLAGNPTA